MRKFSKGKKSKKVKKAIAFFTFRFSLFPSKGASLFYLFTFKNPHF